MAEAQNKSLLKAVLAVFTTRLELFSLEFNEEKQRLSQVLAMTVIFSTFLILFVITLLALFLFLLWESPYRYWYICACILAFGLAAWAAFTCLRRLLFNKPPFELSVRELKADIDTLNQQRGD